MDLLDPARFAGGQPHQQFRWLREQAPAYFHPEPDGPGFWAITRYEDVRAVGRDSATFSSEPTIMIRDPDPGSGFDFGDHKMMLMMDPPQHTEYRKLISREFTQAPAHAMSPWIDDFARQIVDAVIEQGSCDFVADIAGEMPSYVIAKLLGLPLDDGRKLYELTEVIHTAPEALPEGAQAEAVRRMFEYAMGVIAQKRARPTDDLASRLLHAEVDGKRLDDTDFLLFFLLLIDAGGDTTRNLVGAGMLALLEHPQQLAQVAADPERYLAGARDELLRWVSPVIYMRRTARQPTRIAGQRIAAGDKVVMYYGAANRDHDAFAAAEQFDITRRPNRHVAFGGGTHICLGQHVARIEIDALLREVLTRMQDIELAAEPEWLASNFISGPRTMPIRFRPAARRKDAKAG
ncbi:MAG: cytochrome P450 [Gammaproteobacteria bacterium]|nr:cytochrome P450 [Gammaproteobacteria bacterium]